MTTVMTYDFGTTSLKAAVVTDGDVVLGSAADTYPLAQHSPGWAEQDPDDLWRAAATAGRSALAHAGARGHDIDGVVFVAPWKGIIPVSAHGTVMRPAIIWMDGRAREQARDLNRAVGRFVGTGQEFWPRLMWLRDHEPDVWNKARWLMGMNSYLKWRACGAVVTEPSDDFIHALARDGTLKFWDVLEGAGLLDHLSRFPPSRPADEVVGGLTSEAAAHLGLVEGTPVVNGLGDLAAITGGAADVEAGASHMYFGTSSWFVAVARDAESIDAPLQFQLERDRAAALYPLQTGCLAYDWIVEQTYREEKRRLGTGIHDYVARDVTQVPAGSGSVIATHWLNGELPPLSKNATGMFVNLTTSHDRRHMVRAMMESICYSHRWSIERYPAKDDIGAITAVGGGATSAVWMQMLADILQRDVVVPAEPRLVGTVGAYRCAVRALRGSAPPRQLASSRTFTPDPQVWEVYRPLYTAYTLLHPSLAAVFDLINEPEEAES